MVSCKCFSARSRSSGYFRLREADVRLSQGRNEVRFCRETGITEQTFYDWRKEYGGMKMSQIKRLKDLERSAADMTPDKMILKKALE